MFRPKFKAGNVSFTLWSNSNGYLLLCTTSAGYFITKMDFASLCKHVCYTVKHFRNLSLLLELQGFTKIYWKMRDYVYWTVHHLDNWIKRDQLGVTCFLFHYLMLNIFRMLIQPSSGACDLFVELFHGLYCSGSMCVGVTVWFGWGGVVSGSGWSLHPDIKLVSLYSTMRD